MIVNLSGQFKNCSQPGDQPLDKIWGLTLLASSIWEDSPTSGSTIPQAESKGDSERSPSDHRSLLPDCGCGVTPSPTSQHCDVHPVWSVARGVSRNKPFLP